MGRVWGWHIISARSILATLPKQHGESLNDEQLRTLLVEVEGIINSTLITCDNIGDVSIIAALNPMQLLSMKTNIVMPPPRIFQKEDVYCYKYQRRVQPVWNEFWTQWKKEVFAILQSLQKWNCPKRNFEVDDAVFVWNDSMRNKWPMAKVIRTYSDKKGLV